MMKKSQDLVKAEDGQVTKVIYRIGGVAGVW